MKSKAMQLAEEAVRMLPEECKELMGKGLIRTFKESLAADIEAEYADQFQSPPARWVKCSERMPNDERQLYYLKIRSIKTIARLDNGKFYSTDYGNGSKPLEGPNVEWLEEFPAPPVEVECDHKPLVDTGVGYYHCPACNKGFTYEEWSKAASVPEREGVAKDEWNYIRKLIPVAEKELEAVMKTVGYAPITLERLVQKVKEYLQSLQSKQP